jgi:demethylmenaquinone methyltransferase/2-methoxy-6-polyprenyl-1,4-benzoquinol methylase
MATFLRPLSYRYQWLYDGISKLATIAVGGENRFRHLPLEGLSVNRDTKVLDLCCGAGQTTQVLAQYSEQVTGLDLSPIALQRAKIRVPQATYVQSRAEAMDLPDQSFDLVHSSAAMHEMTPAQLQCIFQEVFRVLKPQGLFAIVDFHQPHNPIYFPGLALFLTLFETETAWQLLKTDLGEQLTPIGFTVVKHQLHAGGSVQVIQVQKP